MFNKRVLIISPHQDDEIIGCGGLIQKVLQDKGEVFVCHGTMVGGQYIKYDKAKQEYTVYSGKMRMKEMEDSLKILSYNGIINVTLPLFEESFHHKLDTISLADIVSRIEEQIEIVKPHLLLIPACSWDQDHEALNRACLSVMRPHFFNGAVLEYEAVGEQAFTPNFYLELTDKMLEKKLEAINCYKTQNSGNLHQVSVPALETRAEVRGRDIYTNFAEAFTIKRLSV